MKLIDLLVKIANGEDVPKRIIYNKLVYELKEKCYVDYCGETLIGSLCFDGSNLNDEVEIIEDTPKEDKKIEKLVLSKYYGLNVAEKHIINKINEIIDKVNNE